MAEGHCWETMSENEKGDETAVVWLMLLGPVIVLPERVWGNVGLL